MLCLHSACTKQALPVARALGHDGGLHQVEMYCWERVEALYSLLLALVSVGHMFLNPPAWLCSLLALSLESSPTNLRHNLRSLKGFYSEEMPRRSTKRCRVKPFPDAKGQNAVPADGGTATVRRQKMRPSAGG